MIASLPMYDWPEVRDATDALWAGVARRLGTPVGLSRTGSHSDDWHRPDLLFSQTCGYPFTHAFRGRLKLVATPHYGVDGCDGPTYRSIILARRAQPLAGFRGAVAAVNTPDSMSGMLALKLVFAPLASQGRFFARALLSASHLNSMLAVRDGTADLCAVDTVCVAMARAYRPEVIAGLVEIARSPSVPALPYVTVAGDVAALRAALAVAMTDPDLAAARQRLFLAGVSVLGDRDYDRITDLETDMQRAGGLDLL